MTVIEILKECKTAGIEERAIQKQIDRLIRMSGPQGIGSQALKPAGDRKTNNKDEAMLQQLQGMIETLNRKRDECILIMNRAEQIIGKIKDRNSRTILRCYYVEGESDYEIAKEMDMSPQWVQKRRNKTLELLG